MVETPGRDMDTEIQFRGHLLREGFAQVPHSLIRTPRLSPNAKLVMYLLLSRAAKDGTSFEGHVGMSARTGISMSSVRRGLDEVKAAGLVEWKQHGQGKTNTYYVLQDGLDRFVAECSGWTDKNVQLEHSKVFTQDNKEYPVEEEPEKKNQREWDTPTPLEEDDKAVWPDWYAALYAIPGFKKPLKEAGAWLESKHVPPEYAEATAYALKSKWPGPKTNPYRDPWATFQHWVVRPPLNGSQSGGRNGISQTGVAQNQRRPLTVYIPPLDEHGNPILGR